MSSTTTTTTTKKRTVLIVGASFGGLGTARRLCQNGGTDKFRVILVDARDEFTIGGLWQFVWTNRLTMNQIVFPLKDVNLPGIDVRLGSATSRIVQWQIETKQVLLENGSSIPYDYIVMACGVVPDPKPIPGIEHYVNICSFDTVPRQQEETRELLEKARTGEQQTFVLAIGDTPYKCPPAPFELTFLLDEMLVKANVRDKVRMIISCPIAWPMPHPNSEEMFSKEMKSRNIEYLASHVVSKVENDTIHYTNGTTLETSLLWTVYPIRAPDFVQRAARTTGGVVPINDKGTITIDNHVTNTIANVDNAYAIGDCCSVPITEDIAIPKAGEFAWKMGVSVADALVDSANNNGSDDNEQQQQQQKSKSASSIDRLGACVAEVGFGKGIELRSDFSNAIIYQKDAEFKVTESSRGEQEKVEWVNSYLSRIFGDKARTLELSNGDSDSRRKRQKLE